MIAPTGIAWHDSAALFVDRLVDRDIAYLDVQMAIEALLHAGLHDQITVSFELDGQTVHWHRMPILHPGLRPLNIFTTIAQSGLIEVLHIQFADARGQS